MSGRFTNLRYDNEAYNEEILRSTNPLLYRLDPNYAVNCGACFSPCDFSGNKNSSIDVGDKIDIDSILKGINKSNTKANSNQSPIPLDHFKTYKMNECPSTLETQYSRYSHPPYDIKGLNNKDMRLGYPLTDPQCHIFENFGVNTRNQAKDNHKTIWQIPSSQRDLLPNERLGQVKNSAVSSNCNYAPYFP